MPDRNLPWAAMLKVAGVTVAEIAEASGHQPRYVYKQLSGERTLQYDVQKACEGLLVEHRARWYPAVSAMVRLLAEKNKGN